MRLFATLLILLSAVAAATAQDDFDTEAKLYNEGRKRPSLYKRTLARERLADTRDSRAIEILAKDYARPEAPKDQVQYLIASIVNDRFNRAEHMDALDAWRSAHTKDTDAWLWYRCLRNRTALEGTGHALALLADPANSPWLRAAALEAATARPSAHVLSATRDLLNGLPDDKDRWVLVDSAARVFETHASFKDTPDYAALGERLANMLDHENVPARNKLVIARTFQRVFNAPRAWLSSKPWIARLKGEAGEGERGAGATFVGIHTEGRRICYVIDLSDSMLTPLTLKEKEDLQNPVTGENGAGNTPPLPWEEIKTRFDAAREFLKLSLRQLSDEQEFCVIGFGTEAEMLKECGGMARATSRRVDKVFAELDAIKPMPPRTGREHGTLRGMTNMHGGMHRAFKVKSKGMIKEYEYVNRLAFEQGCDTIFLLSDGKQSWADWSADDKSDGQGAGDPETGRSLDKPDTDILHYYGPYVHAGHMLDDIRRLNLFRKCEINCIGIGEAEDDTLKQIAAIGHGKLRLIGR
jgi:hypothetical protein